MSYAAHHTSLPRPRQECFSDRRIPADTAERMTSGQLDQQVTIVTQDEAGILAQAFNKMTGPLRTSIDSLEKRVSTRTREMIIVDDHFLSAPGTGSIQVSPAVALRGDLMPLPWPSACARL